MVATLSRTLLRTAMYVCIALAIVYIPIALVTESKTARAQSNVTKDSQSAHERIAAINAWIDSHQKSDDVQFKEIKDLQLQLAATAVSNEHRITIIEQQQAITEKQYESLTAKLWAVMFAVFAQLLHAGFVYLEKQKKKIESVEDQQHHSHRHEDQEEDE